MLALFAAGGLHAQVASVMTFSMTAYKQADFADNGIITTTALPTKIKIDTKQILILLAQAEYSEMNYDATSFPSGAKLVSISNGTPSPTFQVWDKDNNILVDVSDIMSANALTTNFYGSVINSGKVNDNTGLASPSVTDQQIYTLAFDDTPGGGSLQFYLSGVMANTIADSVPNSTTGVYKETETHTLTSGAGDGNYEGSSILIIGGLKATGSVSLTR